MRNFLDKPYSIQILTALTLVLFLLVSEYLYYLNSEQQKSLKNKEVFNHASSIRLNIEREINTTMNLTMGLTLFVSSNPDFENSQFTIMAKELLDKAPHIRNIGLAKDNIISHVYPLAGNEKALGLKYMDVPDQRAPVLRAIAEHNSVIAGPVNLKQGGQGFISRAPIYYANKPDSFWGLASVVINIDTFYEKCGLLAPEASFEYGLRGKDAKGGNGEVFYGPASLFTEENVVKLPISLPVGEWILAVKPVAPPVTESPVLMALRFFGIFFALAAGFLVFALLSSYRRIQHLALHDPLTGLANRRLFFEHLKQVASAADRNNSHFAVIYIDLNKFKPINDTYGHKYGDHVLIEIADRLTDNLRSSDITARVGGDEFILLMQGTRIPESIDQITAKLHNIIARPIKLDNGASVTVDASIGISIYPDHGSSVDELIRHADLAMYEFKSKYYAKTDLKLAAQ